MNTQSDYILNKVNQLEQGLLELKVSLLDNLGKEKKSSGIYKESLITQDIRKIRKRLWNEKYSKSI